MKQRDYTYDNLKFLLIVLVAVIHCADFFRESIPAFRSVYIFIYLCVMPGFVFVSGLFAGSTLRDGRRTRQRIVYFFVLYIVCELFLTLPQMALHKETEISLFFEAGIPWFMLSMAFWFAVTYFLKDFNPGAVLAFSVLLACFAGYDESIGDFLCLSKTIVFYPFFAAGRLLDHRKISAWFGVKAESGQESAADQKRRLLLKLLGFAGLFLLAALCIWKREWMYGFRPLFSGRDPFSALRIPALGALYRLGYYLVNAGVIFCFLAVIPKKKCWFSGFGARTLQVYFLHYYVIYPLQLFHVAQRLQAFLPDVLCVAVVSMAGALAALVLALPIFEYPFSLLARLCRMQQKKTDMEAGDGK